MKRRDQEEEKEVSGRGECWGEKKRENGGSGGGNSSRWEDVWATGVHSLYECNYCRHPKSECRIKSSLPWPNFIQRALHSHHQVTTKATLKEVPSPAASQWQLQCV